MPIMNRLVYVPQPVNQGQFGVCVAVTLAGVIEGAEFYQRKVGIPMSIKYIYGNRAEGDVQGEGMMPREALQMATRFGVPRRDLLPGIEDYPTSKASITEALDGEGLPNRIKGYVRLRTLQDISDYFTLFNIPVLFGTMLTPSFFDTGIAGVVPPPSSPIVGGHAMRGIGILNGKLVLQNSWGLEWGDSGLCYFDLAMDNMWEAWGVIPETAESLIKRPQTVMLTVGSTTMMVDNTKVVLDVPPTIIKGRTMVPLRAIAESMKAKVEFYGQADGRHMILLRWGGEDEWQSQP
jgi:hypothetical protein